MPIIASAPPSALPSAPAVTTAPQIAPIPQIAAAPPQDAVSWGAVFAGAVVTVATAVVLSQAAAGLGFALGSPWMASGASLAGFTPLTGAYAVVIQVLSFGLGGYVAGRLRTVWLGLHSDEAHFRDTAHGLISWAVATVAGLLLTAWVLAPSAMMLAVATTGSPLSAGPPSPHAADIAAQSALFMAIGLILSAFVSAVAAALGGLRREEMHIKV